MVRNIYVAVSLFRQPIEMVNAVKSSQALARVILTRDSVQRNRSTVDTRRLNVL